MDEEQLNAILESLRNLQHCNIGVIELDASLDIDIVTDIFIRINSKGTALSQGDFVMSKIAADELHGGNAKMVHSIIRLRKKTMRLLLPNILANWNGSKMTRKLFMILNAMMYCV